MSAKLPGVNLS